MNILENLNTVYNNTTAFQVAISLSIIFLYFLYIFLRDLDVLPGPSGFPLFGYWPFLKADTCHVQLKELGRKYGDIFSIRITGSLFIHLGSIKAIREAHLTKSENFEGRMTDYGLITFLFQDGIAFINGEPWKVLRKFFLMKFKEYGMNAVKKNSSCSVYDILKDTVEELRNTNGRPIKITDLATMKCVMVIRRIIFNDEGITKAELQELIDQYNIVVSGQTSTAILLTGNFAKYFIFPLMPSYWSMKRGCKRMEDILLQVIERHESEYDEKRVSNLVDCYFKERDDKRRKNDPTASYFTDRSLANSLSQFIADGGLSIGLFVGIVLSTLVEHPEEQEKIYEEIVDVIGRNRMPAIEDKIELPYTNAFMYEVMRYTDFLPLLPSLQCSKETTLHGYKIPEGSITLVNLHAAHRNSDTYENPDEFNPSRFLPKSDKQRPDLPLLFGVGKRSCIGEAFSMIQIFLFMTTIVQSFRLAYPEGTKGSDHVYWSKEKVQICAYPRSHTKLS